MLKMLTEELSYQHSVASFPENTNSLMPISHFFLVTKRMTDLKCGGWIMVLDLLKDG